MWDRIYKFHRSSLTLGYYPGTPRSFVLFQALIFGLLIHHGKRPFDSISDAVGNFFGAVVIWVVLCYVRKLILKRVLLYRGWMYEGRKASFKTVLAITVIRLFNDWFLPLSTKLYGFQGVLPSLPVPPVHKSVNLFLESIKPVVSAEKYAQFTSLADGFVRHQAKKLQYYLILKSWFCPNYISDWWEKYVYLAGRSSILINSNCYCTDSAINPTTNPAARAALLTHSELVTRRKIQKQELEPLMLNDVIPLCMWQYERMYNTCRIPGESIDTLHHEILDGDHIVVYHKGKYFKVNVYREGRSGTLLSPAEFQMQFERIIHDESTCSQGEKKLAALTTTDRPKWARARKAYFSAGVNKDSLDIIEKSAFLVMLDEEEYFQDLKTDDTSKFDLFGKSLLHGNGYNRWVDKSFSVVVGANGRAGFHFEHSWCEAPILTHAGEYAFRFCLDFKELDENGRITTSVQKEPPMPERLVWDLSQECIEEINAALDCSEQMINDLHLKLLHFRFFGKELMKKCGVSPDAFVQMALQLAYYRDQGKFDLTYESSTARLYLQGRTEAVRSCTQESVQWVKSVQNNLPVKGQIAFFKQACERHQAGFRGAMNGQAFDRHLLGLYVVAQYLKRDTPFLQEALSIPWRLSTSQAPVRQTKLDHTGCPGGGFGPVAEDGYGVSYFLTADDTVFFHISSKHSCMTTDSKRFAMEIQRALLDIKSMFGF